MIGFKFSRHGQCSDLRYQSPSFARTIAGGGEVTDATWAVLAELNANHAQDQAGVTKAAALELLRRNSRIAAAAVRAFTDEELDRTEPSLIGLVETPTLIARHAIRPCGAQSNGGGNK